MEGYVGEIRIFAGNYAPAGWALCNGALMSIAQNEALFTLVGTIYGGDGVQTFAVPDLRGRAIVSQGRARSGTTYPLGMRGGAESITLLSTNIPAHSHTFTVSSAAATTPNPTNGYLAAPCDSVTTNPKTVFGYLPSGTTGISVQPFKADALLTAGGSTPHENRMPYVTLNYIIATVGVFPTSN